MASAVQSTTTTTTTEDSARSFAACVMYLSLAIGLVRHRYYSTDLLVHRNWMSIAHAYPRPGNWYWEETDSYNTLDYPPLFQYATKALTAVTHKYAPDGCLALKSYESARADTDGDCVAFMRLTVTALDVLVYFPTVLYAFKVLRERGEAFSSATGAAAKAPLLLLLCNVPLFILDHVHFQYNSVVLSLLVLTAAFAETRQYLKTAVAYSLLISMKHLFLVLAPAVFVILLRNHCFTPRLRFLPLRFLSLGLLTLSIVVPPLASVLLPSSTGRPFSEGLERVSGRLFPFDRGLTHAYWAPNLWALYAFADRVLMKAGIRPLRPVEGGSSGVVSRLGLGVLPNVGGGFCAAAVVALMVPTLLMLWRRPKCRILPSLALCAMTAFQVGYHVHEKAAMNAAFLLALGCESEADLRLLLGFMGQTGVSFLPLWLGGGPTKAALLLAWQAGAWEVSGLTMQPADMAVHAVIAAQVVLSYAAEIMVPGMEFLPTMIYSVLGGMLNLGFWAVMWIRAGEAGVLNIDKKLS